MSGVPRASKVKTFGRDLWVSNIKELRGPEDRFESSSVGETLGGLGSTLMHASPIFAERRIFRKIGPKW